MTGDKGKSPTLTAAIRRVLSGDVESYEVIHNRIDRPLRAYIRSHFYWAGPDFEDEVAVRTHEYAIPRLGEYNAAKASLQTWYNWQSRSVAGMVMREWFGPRHVQYDEAVHEAWAATTSGPADVYEEKRLSRVLREESESLSEEERQSITLHDIDGLTFDESAEASGLSVMQVRYRRRRALSVLRQRLQEHGVRPVSVDTTPVPIWYGNAAGCDSPNGVTGARATTQGSRVHRLEGRVAPKELGLGESPIWYGRDSTDPDDYAAPTVVILPDGPDTLAGAAARDDKDEG